MAWQESSSDRPAKKIANRRNVQNFKRIKMLQLEEKPDRSHESLIHRNQDKIREEELRLRASFDIFLYLTQVARQSSRFWIYAYA